jgi:LPXTG-motif cell wall-anchored protein
MRKILLSLVISFFSICFSDIVQAEDGRVRVIDQYGEYWSEKSTKKFAKSIFNGNYDDIAIATPSLKGSYKFTIINGWAEAAKVELVDSFTYTDLCPVEFWLDDPENTNVDSDPKYFDLEVGESGDFADALDMNNYLDGKDDIFREYTNADGAQVRYYQFSDVITMNPGEKRDFILYYEWSLATADLIQAYVKSLTVELKVEASSNDNQLENDLRSGILPDTGEKVLSILIIIGLILVIIAMKFIIKRKK